jgi:predicted MFS family arabinose efflux permease
LIGGVITTAISWRAAFVFQAVIVATIILLSRRIKDPIPPDPTRPFDALGAVLSAVGMFLVVFGILQADNDGALMAALLPTGTALPGLLLIGLGLGVMLTPSVNVVQSSFPEQLQGEISGLSRSVSNLGSSFGTAIAGTILVSDLASGNGTYVVAMIVLAGLALIGLAAAWFLPADPQQQGTSSELITPDLPQPAG